MLYVAFINVPFTQSNYIVAYLPSSFFSSPLNFSFASFRSCGIASVMSFAVTLKLRVVNLPSSGLSSAFVVSEQWTCFKKKNCRRIIDIWRHFAEVRPLKTGPNISLTILVQLCSALMPLRGLQRHSTASRARDNSRSLLVDDLGTN